jgi:hypothetical protein
MFTDRNMITPVVSGAMAATSGALTANDQPRSNKLGVILALGNVGVTGSIKVTVGTQPTSGGAVTPLPAGHLVKVNVKTGGAAPVAVSDTYETDATGSFTVPAVPNNSNIEVVPAQRDVWGSPFFSVKFTNIAGDVAGRTGSVIRVVSPEDQRYTHNT